MNRQDFHPHVSDFLKNRGYEDYSITTNLDTIDIKVGMADLSTTIQHILATSTNEFIVVEDVFLINDSGEITTSYLNVAIKSEDRVEKLISTLSIYPFKSIHKGQSTLTITSTQSGTIHIPYIIITPNYDSTRRKKSS